MTTRHGDRSKIAGGKHMNLHPGFAQDAILVTWQHCETGAFAFPIFIATAVSIPNPAAGKAVATG